MLGVRCDVDIFKPITSADSINIEVYVRIYPILYQKCFKNCCYYNISIVRVGYVLIFNPLTGFRISLYLCADDGTYMILNMAYYTYKFSTVYELYPYPL